jgi:integrase
MTDMTGTPAAAIVCDTPPDPPATAVPHRSPAPAQPLARPQGGARRLATTSRRLYRADWQLFASWCAAQGHRALPAAPATVAAFLAAAGVTLRPGTLARRAAAIAHHHRQHRVPAPTSDPAVTALLRAGRRHATRRPPLRPAQLVRLAAACPRDAAGLRDRALLLLAAAAPGRNGLGQSALLGLTVEQLRFAEPGLDVSLPVASRLDADPLVDAAVGATDTAPAHRRVIAAAGDRPGLCPVQALRDWLAASDTRFGPVFRKVDRWGNVEHHGLGPDALRRIIARRTRRRSRHAGTPP